MTPSSKRIALYPGRWCVYAHRVNGELVYIGSGDANRPFEFKRPSQPLWCGVVLTAERVEVEILGWYKRRRVARQAEQRLIARHRPRCNVKIHPEERARSDFEKRLAKLPTGQHLSERKKQAALALLEERLAAMEAE